MQGIQGMPGMDGGNSCNNSNNNRSNKKTRSWCKNRINCRNLRSSSSNNSSNYGNNVNSYSSNKNRRFGWSWNDSLLRLIGPIRCANKASTHNMALSLPAIDRTRKYRLKKMAPRTGASTLVRSIRV